MLVLEFPLSCIQEIVLFQYKQLNEYPRSTDISELILQKKAYKCTRVITLISMVLNRSV